MFAGFMPSAEARLTRATTRDSGQFFDPAAATSSAASTAYYSERLTYRKRAYRAAGSQKRVSSSVERADRSQRVRRTRLRIAPRAPSASLYGGGGGQRRWSSARLVRLVDGMRAAAVLK